MPIVFACPRCRFVMKAPDDKGGLKIKCSQCDVTLEIPFLRGILVDVPPEQAAPVVFGVSGVKHGSGAGITPKPAALTAQGVATAPKALRADDYLREAAQLKDENDLEGAVKLLRRGFEEIKREKALYAIDTFLRLPLYLQQAGRDKDAWQEFNLLLTHGYPNQPRDVVLIYQERGKVLEKMRWYLQHDGKEAIASVYEIFAQVCKAVAVHKENRTREMRAFFTKAVCNECIDGLKKYPGNLGRLQPIKEAIVDELGRFPDVDFDKLAERIDAALAVRG